MQPKPGWKSTEFLVTVLTALASLGAAVGGLLPPEKAAIVAAIVAALYSLSRGLAKVGMPPPMMGPAGTAEVGKRADLPPPRMGS